MPKFLTTSEAAALIGVSASTVSRMLDRGELAGYQFPNGTIRLEECELKEWLQRCRIDNQPKEATQ